MASGALVQRGLTTVPTRTVLRPSGAGTDLTRRTLGVVTTQSLGGDLGGQIGGAIGGDIGAGIGTALGGYIEDRLVGGNKPGGGTPNQLVAGSSGGTCPSGTISVGGKCFDLVPGGQTQGQGMMVPSLGGGQLLPGAVAPGAVATTRLRCPEGMVLGRDNLCYWKQVLPKGFRKWKPAAKPPISAADAKAIRRADSARNRVKKLAMKTGFTCKRK